MGGLGGQQTHISVILLTKNKQKNEDDKSRALHYQETPRSVTQLIRRTLSLKRKEKKRKREKKKTR
jgi:hypothetical protein